jgi:thiamine pyrophosphokinase
MREVTGAGRYELLSSALEHLRLSLHLLDQGAAPPAIGARVDHAIHELYLLIAEMTAGDGFTQIDRNAVPQ